MDNEAPRHILCPVDFSDLSALALRYAAAFARCAQARVTALFANAFSPPPYFTHGQIEQLETRHRELQRQAETSLQEFVKRTLGPAGEAEIMLVEAPPVEAIFAAAAEARTDLIVMGTHGRSGIRRWMLGSVAERVLRESEVPVLTVRGDPARAEIHDQIRYVVCPVNDSAVARQSLDYAARLARCFGAALTIVHVREPHGRGSIENLCAWVPGDVRAQCEIRETTREGEPAREIVKLASEQACDLLVIGAQHRRFFDSTVIGTTTVRVVRHAPCPVLTVIARNSEEVVGA